MGSTLGANCQASPQPNTLEEGAEKQVTKSANFLEEKKMKVDIKTQR